MRILPLQLRYSLYTQSIQLPTFLDDCNNINPNFSTSFPNLQALTAARARALTGTTLWASSFTSNSAAGLQTDCYALGQASLPIRTELGLGTIITSSAGYGLIYNTLDNNKNPTSGLNVNFGQDFAGARRQLLFHSIRHRRSRLLRARSPTSSASCICRRVT